MSVDPVYEPEKVLQHRVIERDGQQVAQVLIKWKGAESDGDTWLDVADMRGQFPDLSLALRTRLFRRTELLIEGRQYGVFLQGH